MDGSYCLTHEEHGRGDADDPQPVGERQGYDVEEGAAYSHYQYLAYKHHSGYNQELSAVAQEKGRTAGGKSACVERFQSWSMTKMVKKRLSSLGDSPA